MKVNWKCNSQIFFKCCSLCVRIIGRSVSCDRTTGWVLSHNPLCQVRMPRVVSLLFSSLPSWPNSGDFLHFCSGTAREAGLQKGRAKALWWLFLLRKNEICLRSFTADLFSFPLLMIPSSSQVSFSLCGTQRNLFAPFSLIFPVTRRIGAEIRALISQKKLHRLLISNGWWKAVLRAAGALACAYISRVGGGGCSDAV